jgi:cytoskeletal protein RodZ
MMGGSFRSVGVIGRMSALFVLAMLASFAVSQTTEEKPSARTGSRTADESHVADVPDSPGATLASLQTGPGMSPAQTTPPPTSPPSAPSAPASGTAAQNEAALQLSEEPVGTAAAQPLHANGIAASQPAGVAIAPGKQRRARTIVISLGVILGAGVAIGSVAALTAGTSSRPPGAH